MEHHGPQPGRSPSGSALWNPYPLALGMVYVCEVSSRNDSLTCSSLWPHMKSVWESVLPSELSSSKSLASPQSRMGWEVKNCFKPWTSKDFSSPSSWFLWQCDSQKRRWLMIHFFESGPYDSSHTQSYFLDIVIKSTLFLCLFTSMLFSLFAKYTEAIRNNSGKAIPLLWFLPQITASHWELLLHICHLKPFLVPCLTESIMNLWFSILQLKLLGSLFYFISACKLMDSFLSYLFLVIHIKFSQKHC